MTALNGKSILITGAGGFIGSCVTAAAVRDGAIVRAHLGPPGAVSDREIPGARTFVAEIDDAEALAEMVRGVEIVIHLAGPASVAASFQNAAEYARIHVAGTAAVLDAARNAGVRRVVYLSSAEVYGMPATNPVTESHPLSPRSPYGAAKAGAERFVELSTKSSDLEAIILRPFSIYGPGLSPISLIGGLLHQVLHEDKILIGDQRPVRDYCYIDDVADAICRACSAQIRGLGVFNIATGVGTSVGDLLQTVLKLAARPLPVQTDPARLRPAGTEILKLVGSAEAAQIGLGWSATTSLADGLLQTFRWMEGLCPSAS
jgi:nucleoside-diphosphate-sugar epimerase